MVDNEFKQHVSSTISMLDVVKNESKNNSTKVNNDSLINVITFIKNIVYNNDDKSCTTKEKLLL